MSNLGGFALVNKKAYRVPEPHHLNGCRPQSEDLVPRSFSVAVHVQEDMNSIRIDAVSSSAIAGDLKGRVYIIHTLQ